MQKIRRERTMGKWLKIIIAITIIVGALLSAPLLVGEQGYVLFSLGHWTVEGTVISFAVAIVLTTIAFYIVIKLVQYVFMMLIWPSKWWQKFHAKKQTGFYQNGLNLMALGQWQLASETFLKVRRHERIESARTLSLICAARANNKECTDTTLAALSLSSSNDVIDPKVNLPFAQLVIACQNQNYDAALALLNSIDLPVLKQSIPFQQLWLEITIYNHQWAELDKYLPKINKAIKKEFSESAYKDWMQTLAEWLELGFAGFVSKNSLNQLEQAWQTLQKHNRKESALLFAYLAALASAQQSDKIEEILLEQHKLLNNEVILSVIRRYYQVNHVVQMDKLFHRVHQQLSKMPDDKTLLTILGYLAAGQRDHTLAKQALQKVVYSQKNVTDTKLFAQELALLGETQKSLEVYHSL